MRNIPDHLLKKFLETAHIIAEKGLVQQGAGNLSLRMTMNRMLISASGAHLSALDSYSIAVCSIETGQTESGDDVSDLHKPKPSIEAPLHTAILRRRPDLNMVLHFQSPYATAVACSRNVDKLNFNVIPELPHFIGTVQAIDFDLPGSQELADAAAHAMSRCNLVLLKNHGQITGGRDASELLNRAVFFELACRILTLAEKPTAIPDHEVAILRQKGRDARASSI
jgi:ribulose-5-phosphate 4-epimerase/fuculose-1-phosphate aldolase